MPSARGHAKRKDHWKSYKAQRPTEEEIKKKRIKRDKKNRVCKKHTATNLTSLTDQRLDKNAPMRPISGYNAVRKHKKEKRKKRKTKIQKRSRKNEKESIPSPILKKEIRQPEKKKKAKKEDCGTKRERYQVAKFSNRTAVECSETTPPAATCSCPEITPSDRTSHRASSPSHRCPSIQSVSPHNPTQSSNRLVSSAWKPAPPPHKLHPL